MKPENPHAFACAAGFEMDKTDVHEQRGMTLRDYFAGQALAGLCVYLGTQDRIDIAEGIKGGKFLAGAAYGIANAMLKARENAE